MNTCRNSDASFYTISSTPSERGLIARTQSSSGPGTGVNGSLTIDQTNPYFIVTEVDQSNAVVGQIVQKMGRTSGWTWGAIQATCVDHHNGNWPGYKSTDCTYQANYRDLAGDSGGPIFMFPGGSSGGSGEIVSLTGIQLGDVDGYAVFSKWGRVVTDLGALVATRPTTLGQPSLSGSVSSSHPSLTWSAISGASKYDVYRVVWNGSSYTTQLAGSPTSASFLDSPITSYGYYGATQPAAPSTAVQYFAYARNQTAVSPKSGLVWYSTTPVTTSISGPSGAGEGSTQTWTAPTWGGALAYSFQWLVNSVYAGSSQSLTIQVGDSDFDLRVNVTDGLGATTFATKTVTVCPPPQISCE